MAQLVELHPENPHTRRVNQIVEQLRQGAVIAYPTGLAYALGCCIGNRDALMRLGRVRALPKHHLFTLACLDVSQMSEFGDISNSAFRLIRSHEPGHFTYVLPATRAVPRQVMNGRRKTIGLRLAATPTVRALLSALGGPMITTTLRPEDDALPMVDPYEIDAEVGQYLESIVISDPGLLEESTVIDFTQEEPQVLRQGIGQW